jgi:hypothetical protein
MMPNILPDSTWALAVGQWLVLTALLLLALAGTVGAAALLVKGLRWLHRESKAGLAGEDLAQAAHYGQAAARWAAPWLDEPDDLVIRLLAHAWQTDPTIVVTRAQQWLVALEQVSRWLPALKNILDDPPDSRSPVSPDDGQG